MTKTYVDTWMDQEFTFMDRDISKQTVALWLLGAPALIPLFFMLPAIITGNNSTLNNAIADVLGTGAEALLFATLLITPMITLTGQRWFTPLRKWYGIMFALTAITDAIVASVTTSFAGGVFGRLAGHSFLLAGFTMVLVAIPVLATSNRWGQRRLGRHWKQLQRMTYVIWGLLFIHLALLFGFGSNSIGKPDGDLVFHQRLFQYGACGVPLLVFRLPPVKRWISNQRKVGRERLVYLCSVPLAALFVLGFCFIVNEETYKGVAAFTLHPINN